MNIVALAGGFVVLLTIQYAVLFSTGRIVSFYMTDALRTIVAINFVPLMVIVAVISTFTYRRTGSYVPAPTDFAIALVAVAVLATTRFSILVVLAGCVLVSVLRVSVLGRKAASQAVMGGDRR